MPIPLRTSASARLGVTTAASGNNRRRIAASPCSLSSRIPLLETITGSTTGRGNSNSSMARATATTIPGSASAPVFIACGRNCIIRAPICAPTISGSSAAVLNTRLLFCATTTATTEQSIRRRARRRSSGPPVSPPRRTDRCRLPSRLLVGWSCDEGSTAAQRGHPGVQIGLSQLCVYMMGGRAAGAH